MDVATPENTLFYIEDPVGDGSKELVQGIFAEAFGSQRVDLPTVSTDPVVQSRYLAMRQRGESHNVAEVLALRRMPAVTGTNDQFMRGHEKDQFANEPVYGKAVRDHAAKCGVSTVGKVYKQTLAAYPGDPRAWVSDKHDVQALCEQRGWGCSGAVKVAPQKYHDVPDVAPNYVAPDIVDAHISDLAEQDPGLMERTPLPELRAQVAEKLGGNGLG